MWEQYSLYTLPPRNGRLGKLEELPKERSLLDCMIHKATSEATAGKKVYLLAMDITDRSLLRRIHCYLKPDIMELAQTVKGKFFACTPQIRPRIFDVPRWFEAVPEEGATVVIYGADMIFNSYAAAVKALKKAQEEKNCEIIFAWRDEDAPAMPPPVFFEAWDEMNPVKFQEEYMQQIVPDTSIPVHTPFKLTKEECYSNPRLMQDPLLLYCPSKELAYKLDPEDPWDRRLLDAFNSANKMG